MVNTKSFRITSTNWPFKLYIERSTFAFWLIENSILVDGLNGLGYTSLIWKLERLLVYISTYSPCESTIIKSSGISSNTRVIVSMKWLFV